MTRLDRIEAKLLRTIEQAAGAGDKQAAKWLAKWRRRKKAKDLLWKRLRRQVDAAEKTLRQIEEFASAITIHGR